MKIFYAFAPFLRVLNVIFYLAAFLFSGLSSMAQSHAEIRNVDFTVRNDTMFVNYDLLKAGRNEQFVISLTIQTSSGKILYPQALTGDVGMNIIGGKGKQIFWSINRDNIFINEEISAKITIESSIIQSKFVHRGIAVLLSAVVPGLGITKLNNGGPYWIMAIAFYGCAAGSYLFYRFAETDYNKYLASMDTQERNKFYNNVQTQNTISDVLMYTAGAVWLGNMIWTLIEPNKTNPGKKGISFGGSYDPVAKTPVFSLKVKF